LTCYPHRHGGQGVVTRCAEQAVYARYSSLQEEFMALLKQDGQDSQDIQKKDITSISCFKI
jgi:hypothetical protein